MKKRTKDGELVSMTDREEAFVLGALSVASALIGVGLYKLYHLIF